MFQLKQFNDILRRPGQRIAMMAGVVFLVPAFAGVTTDGSVGAVQSLSGAMVIPQTLGRLAGNNLFHSFATFNINTGESANFTTTTTTLANVISRVTGGSPSTINGQLKLTPAAGTPGFWFINPAGVTFGAGASIDIPGAFHVGTADYVKFPDGNFYADLTKMSTFSIAAPEAFGFLSTTPTKLLVDGANLNNYMKDIEIAAGDIELINHASLNTATLTALPGGNITVLALGNFSANTSSVTSGAFGSGQAGNIRIDVRGILTLDGGAISSDSYVLLGGGAGNLSISAGSLVMKGQLTAPTQIVSNTFGTRDAGSVSIRVRGDLSITGGGVITSSSRFGLGNAGAVFIEAGNIFLSKDNTSNTNVVISSQTGDPRVAGPFTGYGNGGAIVISTPGSLTLEGGAKIISGTSTLHGSAGSISINAGRLVVDGYLGDASTPSEISARAYHLAGGSSSGQTGNINISASDIVLSNRGQISIQNDATVADPSLLTPTTLAVTAPRITLKDASINATSTGNVAASNIVLNFTDLLHLDPSSITTSAQNGNGGAITINGVGLIWLDNSQIITSVLGLTGNGGDITINADALFLNTGFIQANTAAAGATGGTVNINVPTILSSGSSLLVGGATQYVFQPGVFGYNVIQAAAPDGVSGAINMMGPVLDVSGSLAAIGAPLLDAGGIGRNVCQTTEGSSLSATGWDSLLPSARDPLSVFSPSSKPGISGNASFD